MIYKTFKQWKNGKFLEHFGPRKANYSQDQLDLIEMGWKYGYDAGIEAERQACIDIIQIEHIAKPEIIRAIKERGKK